MALLPNFGDLSAMGSKVSEFIAHAKQMLETVLQGISTLGENQVKSHRAILAEIAELRAEVRALSERKEKKESEND